MQKQTIKQLQNKLLTWYEHFGRKNLAWRDFKSEAWKEFKINKAYGVYISEIMLQQTQVKTVLERFYFPFLKKFPSLQSLASADEDELLKAWQGLGYYSRARNLKKAASFCMKHFEGVLPQKTSDLEKLSGIGSYTAGAIACFGYCKAVAFFDANIKRVLCRVFALENPSKKILQNKAELILNLNNAFDHNQALLDLGALICLAKNPKCGLCPLYDFCLAKFSPHCYPKNKKIIYENLELKLFLLEFNKEFAVKKSSQKLYQGMYNFPLDKEYKYNSKMRFIGEFKHSYTKYKLRIKIYHQKLLERDENFEFKSLENLDNIALSSLSLKALKFLVKL